MVITRRKPRRVMKWPKVAVSLWVISVEHAKHRTFQDRKSWNTRSVGHCWRALSANSQFLKLRLCGQHSLTLGPVFTEGIEVQSIHIDLFCDKEIQRSLLNNFQNCSTGYLFTLSRSGMHPTKQPLHVHTFQNESSSFPLVRKGFCWLFLAEFSQMFYFS